MIVRLYKPEDQQAIELIQQESQSSLRANTPEGFFSDLTNIPAAFEGGLFLVAELEGRVAGFGGLFADGEIVRMRVRADCRRKGVATHILQALIAGAKQLGMKQVHLHTLEEQHSAQQLYLAFGFVETERGELHGNRVVAYHLSID